MQKTDTQPADTPSSTETGTGRTCAACPHDHDAHDRIGTRYCSATITGALSRGCVCVGEARASAPQPR
ncbi:RGCVC family protein [Pseudonocardia sp. MH-G8]|uniref:RGCVC family protein n=1 Tax=Pseudonocardia sp. MH-G8 TaxID=1854588 RepID=UPI00117A16F0|nr:RGCVC family protein [Pseudonocardia sp. MH-G8]